MKNNIFMEKIEVEIFVTKFFSSEFDLKLQAVDATLQTIFFYNFVALCLYFLLI